jgi:hypothetical protein
VDTGPISNQLAWARSWRCWHCAMQYSSNGQRAGHLSAQLVTCAKRTAAAHFTRPSARSGGARLWKTEWLKRCGMRFKPRLINALFDSPLPRLSTQYA